MSQYVAQLGLLFLIAFSTGVKAELTYAELGQLTASPDYLEGRFTQEKYLAFLDANLQSSGVFIYQRGESIRWVTQSPIANELIITPAQIVTQEGGEEVSRLSADSNPVAKMMSTIFFAVLTSDWQELAKVFRLEGQQNGTGWEAILKPIDPQMAQFIHSVNISGDKYLRELILHEAGNNRTRILFPDAGSSSVNIPR